MSGRNRERTMKRLIRNKFLSLLIVVFFTMGLSGCGSNSSSGSGQYTKKNIPEKFMADVPPTLVNGTPDTAPAKKVMRKALKGSDEINEIETSGVCAPMGYDYLRDITSDVEEFKTQAEYEFMIMDSIFKEAEKYVAENGNPIPAGAIEVQFSSAMKTKLLAGLPVEIYGDVFVSFFSTLLDAYVGETILNPEMTLDLDPSDSDGDGFNFTITYPCLAGPDFEDLIDDVFDTLEDGADLSSIEIEPIDNDPAAGDDEETTIVRWNTEKTIISITKKEEEIEDGAIEVSTEICTYNTTTGIMTFTETEKDSEEESKYTISIEEKPGSDMVKTKSTEITTYLSADFETIVEIEAVADKNGGYLIETFAYTDTSSTAAPGAMISSTLKETFAQDGVVTGVYSIDPNTSEWIKESCDNLNDEEGYYDDYELEWDSFTGETLCVTVNGIVEADASIVLVPENVAAPDEPGFDSVEFASRITGAGFIDEGDVFVSYWGGSEQLNSLNVFKEEFTGVNGTTVTYTLISSATVTETSCDN